MYGPALFVAVFVIIMDNRKFSPNLCQVVVYSVAVWWQDGQQSLADGLFFDSLLKFEKITVTLHIILWWLFLLNVFTTSNPGVKTIEEELVNALYKAEAITEDGKACLGKVSVLFLIFVSLIFLLK